jgi:Hg(II)-responsive transcriptional regulator
MNDGARSTGDVAREAGVNIQTLRYYERRGLLRAPQRSEGGHRQYPAESVRLVRFIKRAQDLGFTLKEVEELLVLRSARGRECSRVQRLTLAKLKDVDEKIAQLRAIRRVISTLAGSCDSRDETLDCPILEALDDHPRARNRVQVGEQVRPKPNHMPNGGRT